MCVFRLSACCLMASGDAAGVEGLARVLAVGRLALGGD